MQVLAATQMPEEPAGWFQGTADSIRKFIWILEVVDIFLFMDDHSLILVALLQRVLLYLFRIITITKLLSTL
jgi:hypothetical protein